MAAPRPIDPRQVALAGAGKLTTELIELVRQLRVAVANDPEPPAFEAPPQGGRLQTGDLRAAMSAASRRSSRRIPHLFASPRVDRR